MPKSCEVCSVALPDDYGNLLCDKHYNELVEEKKRLEEQEKPKEESPTPTPADPSFGIKDPQYLENPEKEYPWDTNLRLFLTNHVLLWHDRIAIYNTIKNYGWEIIKAHPQYPKFIWKPKIADIGCSIGVGSNILSQEADFVWGIDKNEKAISFANQAFARIKNNTYWSPQISFDVVDITNEEREVMAFDIVAAVELVEHIHDVKKALMFLKRLCKKDKKGRYLDAELGSEGPYGTVTFITSPNRNAPQIHKDRPFNPLHVREWTIPEALEVLRNYWLNVIPCDWEGNPVQDDSIVSPILYRCTRPL